VSQGTSAPTEQPAGGVTADVQGQGTQPAQPDPFADLPSVEELNQQAEQGVKYAKALANLRGVIDPLRTQHTELTERFKPFESVADRFQSAEEVQRVIELQDSLIGWQNDPDTGQPVPATEQGAQKLAELYPQHADYLTADLLDLPTRDPATGQMVPRIDVVLAGMAADPVERARALKLLGGVEPSAIAPQWQPTIEELAVIPLDPNNPTSEEKAWQDIYRKLPYEKREELKLANTDFIRDYLQDQKLKQDLVDYKQQSEAYAAQQQQQREQYVTQQANQAGETYLSTQLNDALTTFHQSVVQQCQFIKPLDPASLPQGMTAEQAAQMNQQIAASNKAEAAQITGMIVSLFNPQTAAYVVPLLKEIGAVDDKLLGELKRAADSFGSNGRNYGNLQWRGQLGANGNGYQPTADVTQLGNESSRALKTMVGYANQIKARLMERRSQFFELRAQQHNSTLNGVAATRPSINGTAFDPTAAASNGQRIPAAGLSRDDIARLYG
jgi:hypothetical protein